jgi:hypothetical protein
MNEKWWMYLKGKLYDEFMAVLRRERQMEV